MVKPQHKPIQYHRWPQPPLVQAKRDSTSPLKAFTPLPPEFLLQVGRKHQRAQAEGKDWMHAKYKGQKDVLEKVPQNAKKNAKNAKKKRKKTQISLKPKKHKKNAKKTH